MEPGDLEAENRALRARIAELESTPEVDPMLVALAKYGPSYMTVVNPDGVLIATGRQSAGFGSVIGRSAYEFVAPESHETLRGALAQACATGQRVTYEVNAYAEDGTPGHFYRVGAVPLGEAGNVHAILLVPTDITDRVRLERALAESGQALRLAVDATRIGLWRWEIAENRVEWDERLLQIWGLRETPATYEAYREFIHPEDRASVEAAIAQALTTGSYPTFEHRLRKVDSGEDRYVLAVGTVLKDSDGKPARLMGGVLDITDQKKMELQMARAGRVEAIGQLAAGIAHNFNNLLTVILPSVEQSMAASTTPESRERLGAALDAAVQAREVVKSLLDLARRRAADEASSSSDPKTVCQRAVGLCRSTFPREIDLVLSMDESVGVVPMLAYELEQVLLNLLFNARDAVADVSATSRKVRVELDRVADADARSVRIRVVDDGVGMTEEVRTRLFEPFFTTKPPHRGSGLGLANALLRVREAGGTLRCTSVPGEGSTFEILLPEVGPAPLPEQPSAPESGKPRGEAILLVDDEPLIRKVIRRLLELEGYSVVEAASASEARACLRDAKLPIELIILDNSMPGESGLVALPSLRALSQAPVILFSGIGGEPQDGVAHILQKPARPPELLSVVRKVLDGS